MPELLSAYQFLDLADLPLTRERILARARELGLKGTVLLAGEGINFSLGGRPEDLAAWEAWLAEHLRIDALVRNPQTVEVVPFLRLKVRIRPEIITFDPALRPDRSPGARHLPPEDWHRLLSEGGAQLVDTRNQYEVAIGTFAGAADPQIDSFTDFKDWARTHLDPARPVAMFCTGGVRCEKAGAWLLAEGYGEVYQLEGGILNYLRDIPPETSLWRGECFVFDDRVSVDHALKPSGRPLCAGCRRPAEGLSPDGMPPVDEEGACSLCHEKFTPQRLSGLRERVRQVALAVTRGSSHLGPQAD